MKRLFIVFGGLLVILALRGSGVSEAAEPGNVLWLEAEQFAKTGGWANDSQFVDLMGSPYLLATGVGSPVNDAMTKARVPVPGKYRLWVRCKDWLPDHSPGQFLVTIAGKKSAVVFGKTRTADWRWVDGGTFDLRAGEVEIRLHDLTGWWGRCDALVLSSDEQFRPADDLQALARQRETYGGVSREVRDPDPYDVVVVGGGLAGAGAAVAASRLGMRVALIQDRPVLGGNASREIGVPPEGDKSNEPLDPIETGIIEEFTPAEGKMGDWSATLDSVVRAEPKLDLYLNTRATGSEMKDKKTIEAIQALNVRDGTRLRLSGRIFIDCTGDGWVGFWAGAEYRHGREARGEYDESLAPPEADGHTMGNTLYGMTFRTHDRPVEFKAPPWAYQWTSPDDFEKRPRMVVHTSGERPAGWEGMPKGKGGRPGNPGGGHRTWWVEFGGMNDTIQEAEWIRDELFRINIGLWDYVKNYDPRFKQQNRNRELVWLNFVPGKRESRRLIGDYVMTQRDYQEKIVHPDTVAYQGWGSDIHHPWGFYARGPIYFSAFRYKVSIPYRCLYSKNISNLMMAGRDVSVSHVALGGVRVMRTCCLMGQAAGTAAAIAVKEYTTPRGVYEKHIDQLQDQLLKDGFYLMGRSNRDPRDLARTARVAASSVARIPNPRSATGLPNGGVIHDLNTNRAVMFTAKSDRLDSVELFLRSNNEKPTPIRAVLRAAKAFGDFSATANLAEANATVPPKTAGWVSFDLKARLESGKCYYVALPPAAGLKWDLYPYEPKGTTRAYGGPDWKPMYGTYKFNLNPGGEPAIPEGYVPADPLLALEAANVINGWNRAVRGAPNSWGPDPSEPLPQWLELDFGKPVRFNTVHVTFQLARMAAEAFRVDVAAEDGSWRTVARVEGNELRRCVESFEAVTSNRLRVVMEKARTPNLAPRICEIRVYDEAGS